MESNKGKSHMNVSSFNKDSKDSKDEEPEDKDEKEFKPIPLSKKGNSTNLRSFISAEVKDKCENQGNDG